MAEDRSVPGDGIDDVVEKLRRCNPVDIETLPSSRSTEATTALERILDSGDEPEIAEPDSEPDESSPSPAAGDPAGEKGRRRVQRRGDS
jgi:hypothetical protein